MESDEKLKFYKTQHDVLKSERDELLECIKEVYSQLVDDEVIYATNLIEACLEGYGGI